MIKGFVDNAPFININPSFTFPLIKDLLIHEDIFSPIIVLGKMLERFNIARIYRVFKWIKSLFKSNKIFP